MNAAHYRRAEARARSIAEGCQDWPRRRRAALKAATRFARVARRLERKEARR